MHGLLPGRATRDGTRRFAERSQAAPGHWRSLGELTVSSLGLGTYLGNPTPTDDARYQQAVATVLGHAVNVIDTAINYRYQRSERNVGQALRQAAGTGAVSRDEVVVATKAGFLPFDGQRPADAREYIHKTYVESGIADARDIAAGCHCMAPAYLRDQLSRSQRNLGLETIDIFYLHNPETQLGEIDRGAFLGRMRRAFETLEQARAAGAIAMYGTATWNGYRVGRGDPHYLDLGELVAMARDAGGVNHGFRVIQLPYSMTMPEAAVQHTQAGSSPTAERATLLEAAAEHGIYVMCSAPISQGKLARTLPPEIAEAMPGLDTHAQRALQLVRSTPGLGTALVGMKQPEHVHGNLHLVTVPPEPAATVAAIMDRGRGA